MKFGFKFLILFFGFSLSVFANQAEESGTRNSSSHLEAEYQQAKAFYDQGAFNEAFSAFEVLLMKAPANGFYNFYYAMSAVALKRYDHAIAAFDRVLMLNPQSTRTRLELAKLYFEMGEYQLAQAELDIALSANLPDTVRANVMAFKKRIDQSQSRHSHSTTLVLGLNYDSNANNDIGAGNSFALDGFGGLELSGNDEEQDFGFGQTLVYNHGYDLGERGGWTLESQAVGFNRVNKEYSQNNVFYLGAKTAPTYKHDIYKVALPFEIDRVYVDGDGYLTNVSLGASLEQLLSAKQTLTANYKLRAMSYDGDNKNRNAWSNLYGMNYRQAFGGKPLILSASFSYESRHQTKNAASDPASLTEKIFKVEASKVITSRWKASAALTLMATNYVRESSVFANKRADQIKKIDIGGQYQLDRVSLLSLGLTHAMHDSNQGPYAFNKTQLNANYIRRF